MIGGSFAGGNGASAVLASHATADPKLSSQRRKEGRLRFGLSPPGILHLRLPGEVLARSRDPPASRARPTHTATSVPHCRYGCRRQTPPSPALVLFLTPAQKAPRPFSTQVLPSTPRFYEVAGAAVSLIYVLLNRFRCSESAAVRGRMLIARSSWAVT